MLLTQMLLPSNVIPQGDLPVGKVPRFAPSLARSFGHRVVEQARHPNVRTIESALSRHVSDRECSQHRAVIGADLRYGVLWRIDHPYVCAVKGGTVWVTADFDVRN
jgi:hypothetical protein